jgi:predicted GH43/DUF377 family glycosyl hydrolase
MKHKIALLLSLFIFLFISCIENKVLPEEKSTTEFKAYEANPVIKPGSKGQWDAGALGSMSVLKVGNVFHMYYEAWGVRSEKEWDAEEYESLQIGHATSRDGIQWTKDPQNPVLPRGAIGEWDRTGTWDPFVIYEDGLYKMWYGGGGGGEPCNWAYAVSKDGTHFEKKGKLSEIGHVEDCHVVHDRDSGLYYMYYWDRRHEPMGLFCATSATETGFDFDKAVNIKIGRENYPEMYKFTHVLKDQDGWHMFYADFKRPHCPDSFTRYATSTDGIHWQARNKKLLEGHDAEILKVSDDLYLMYYGPRNHFDAKDCDIRLAIYNGRLCDLIASKSNVPGSAPAMQWHKGHGTDNGDHVHYGLQTSDGGYIMAGQTSEPTRDSSDMLVVKTDAQGELQWQKIIGTREQADCGNFVTEVSDGYLVAGALYDRGGQRRALVKLDSEGKIVWKKSYPADGNGSIRGIDKTGDGGIVATGYVGSRERGYQFISDDGQGFILKTDADGNLQWEKILSSAPHGMRVEEIAGGYAIAGNVWTNESGKHHQNVCLILTDNKGNETFSGSYGGDGDDQVFDFTVTTDGGYIFGGHSRSPSYGTVNWDFLLLKVGSDKKEQWHKTFGQPRGYDARYIHDESYGVKQTPDGGYIVVGGTGDEYEYSESGHPKGRSDLWWAYAVKTDADGNLMWEGLYGSLEGNNAGEYINLTNDAGYIIFTDSDTAGAMEENNFGLMKIAPNHVCD